MKIQIEISNREQAAKFLTWVKFRGDILLDALEPYEGEDADTPARHPRYVYVVSASEIEAGNDLGGKVTL